MGVPSPERQSPAGPVGELAERDVSDERTVDRDDHASHVLGLSRAATVGLAAWIAFAVADLVVAELIGAGRLGYLLALRAAGAVVIGLGAVRLRVKPPPSSRTIRGLDTFVFTSVSVLVSAQCLFFGGIASPLAAGIVVVLATRIATLPSRWQEGLLPIGLTALAHPVTLLALSAASPALAAQLSDRHALGQLVLNLLFVLGAAGITLVGSHQVWALRQKVYEERSLGRYRLKRRVGRGGMGEVWVARHATLRRDVAVKIIRPDRMDETAAARFEREVRATSELSHPNTVRVYDYGVTEDGLCYYAMELLEGEDLGSVIQREGTLSPRRTASLAVQAARGLAEAHARGIVHRDLKPANLFLARVGVDDEIVKVLDFGLARLREPDLDSALTSTGRIVGTPAYIAPEVLVGLPADARADVYALGAVMYRLLTGVVPFASDDRQAMLSARIGSDPVAPSALLGRPLPAGLEEVVLTCLRREPDERYATAAELAVALDRWLRADAGEHDGERRGGAASGSAKTGAAEPDPADESAPTAPDGPETVAARRSPGA